VRSIRHTDLPSGTLLVCFGPAHGDHQTIVRLLDIGGIQADQLRPAQGSCEPKQKEPPGPEPYRIIATGLYHAAQVLGHPGTNLVRSDAMDAADAPDSGCYR
jgi:hypothetical protein